MKKIGDCIKIEITKTIGIIICLSGYIDFYFKNFTLTFEFEPKFKLINYSIDRLTVIYPNGQKEYISGDIRLLYIFPLLIIWE